MTIQPIFLKLASGTIPTIVVRGSKDEDGPRCKVSVIVNGSEVRKADYSPNAVTAQEAQIDAVIDAMHYIECDPKRARLTWLIQTPSDLVIGFLADGNRAHKPGIQNRVECLRNLHNRLDVKVEKISPAAARKILV